MLYSKILLTIIICLTCIKVDLKKYQGRRKQDLTVVILMKCYFHCLHTKNKKGL